MFAPEVGAPLDDVLLTGPETDEGLSAASFSEAYDSDPAAIAAALAEAPDKTLKKLEGSSDPVVRTIAKATRRIRAVASQLRNPKVRIQRSVKKLGVNLAPSLAEPLRTETESIRAPIAKALHGEAMLNSVEAQNHLVAGFDPVELASVLVAGSLGARPSIFWPNQAVENAPEGEASARDIIRGIRDDITAVIKVEKETGIWTDKSAAGQGLEPNGKLPPSQAILYNFRSELAARGALDVPLAQEQIKGEALNTGQLLEVAATKLRIELEKLRTQTLLGDGPSIFAYYRLKKAEAELAKRHQASVERFYQAAA